MDTSENGGFPTAHRRDFDGPAGKPTPPDSGVSVDDPVTLCQAGAVTCPLCGVRKAKRGCPALDRQICAVCCGTKRLVEIRCPESCAYLASSRAHPPAVQQKRQQADARQLAPFLHHLTEQQFALVATLHRELGAFRRTAIPPVTDADVAEAAEAAAVTLETAGRGIIYEQRPRSLVAERLLGEFRRALAELERQRVPKLSQEAAIALRSIERSARGIARSGVPSTAFLDLMDRVTAGAPAGADSSAPPSLTGNERRDGDAPRIILS